jgi:hypothetical protein
MRPSTPPRSPRRRAGARGAVASLLAVAAAAAGLLAVAPGAAATAAPGRAALAPGSIRHIVLIELENEGFSTTFSPDSPAVYLNRVLLRRGELVVNYYAIGHDSLDNYIAQVSGQSPTMTTQNDCVTGGGVFAPVTPGTPAPSGQVSGQGCVYPPSVATIANQLDAEYPPNPTTHVAAWRAYEEDMGNDPTRDGGVPDPTGGTDCAHPALGQPIGAVVATPTDQYATRHNPFVWFGSIIDDPALCDANDVPLGGLGSDGVPLPSGHLARDFSRISTTPRFAFITPNLCDDGHDATCAGTNSAGTHQGGLVGADEFLRHWMPLIFSSPAYRSGTMLVMITFDESEVSDGNPGYANACCDEPSGPNTVAPGHVSAISDDQAPGGGRIGAVLLNPRYIRAGSVDRTGDYNHYSALRSFEDLLGLTTGGTDGRGHLGYAGAAGLQPFGPDVFNASR